MDSVRTTHINSMIEYIIARQFPNATGNERKAINGREAVMQEIAQFREQLKRKSEEEIKQLHQDEQKKEWQLRRQEQERRDRSRFFTHPNQKPNYKRYKEKAYWTIREVASLSLNTEPETVKWDIMEYNKDNRIAKEFMDRKDSIERALKAGELKYLATWTTRVVQIAPNDFIKWAVGKNLEIPAELREHFKDSLTPEIDLVAQNQVLEVKYKEIESQLNQMEAECKKLKQDKSHLTTYMNKADELFCAMVKSSNYPEDKVFSNVIKHLRDQKVKVEVSRKTFKTHYDNGCAQIQKPPLKKSK